MQFYIRSRYVRVEFDNDDNFVLYRLQETAESCNMRARFTFDLKHIYTNKIHFINISIYFLIFLFCHKFII